MAVNLHSHTLTERTVSFTVDELLDPKKSEECDCPVIMESKTLFLGSQRWGSIIRKAELWLAHVEIISLSGHTQKFPRTSVCCVTHTHVKQADGKPSGTETGRQRAYFSPTLCESVLCIQHSYVCEYVSFDEATIVLKVQICLCASGCLHAAQPQRQSNSVIRPQRH